MPRPSRLKLQPLNLGPETIGRRLARIRKERGFNQADLARKIGLTSALVCDYEHDRIRLHAEMVIRFAKALGVSTDDILLGSKLSKKNGEEIPLRLLRRVKKINSLPESRQKVLLKSLDFSLRGAQTASDR
jgi:transcriptional regulator with XRE-family HTH domain